MPGLFGLRYSIETSFTASNASSSRQRRCLDKLLDGVDFISLSLEGLTSTDSEGATITAGVTAEAMQ